MTIEFQTFVGKAPHIDAIQVTAENIEELAVWLGSDSYTVEKILVGGRRRVAFNKMSERPGNPKHPYVTPIITVNIGEWIIKIPPAVAANMYETDTYFMAVTQEEIDRFIEQQHKTGEVDLKKE